MPVPTPYLRVDLERLRRNVRRAAEDAATARVRLRPHAKTHKSLDVARLQLASGAVGLTVATVGEAEVFMRNGCTDVLIAYPLWLDQDRALRLRDLADLGRVAFGVDSVEAAARAGRLLGGSGVEVLVEVDSGHHRTGVLPEDAGRVALAASRSGLPVRGVFTFPGHGYAPGEAAAAALAERAALRAAAASLTAAGVEVRLLSGGSTPTLSASLDDPDSIAGQPGAPERELRPGVYVFGDAQQWELGVVEPADVALTCVATVVSVREGHVVLDAGSKALGADRATWSTGFGRLLHDPDARVVQLSEHHAVVAWPEGGTARRPRLGELVEVVPNHVCAAVNLADHLWVQEAGGMRPWPVAARGANA